MTRLACVVLTVTVALALAGCGSSIGDSCSSSSDCAQDGTRICDISSPDGYCTIEGCDFDTCPDEAVCVRFYPGLMTDKTCDPTAVPSECGLDEVCTVQGLCASRTLERRFCMLKCDGDGDCRDHYECRKGDLQARHGGQPVPDPDAEGMSVPDQGFCAAQRACVTSEDCVEPGHECIDRFCVPQ